jgi:uncharacterized protein YdaU (DUF1376 family)
VAERWQQWMPFHIDRWRGSMHVQSMRAAARIGYLYLLAAAWQSDDCSLSDDDEELQIRAALDDEEWRENSAAILRRFTKGEDGRLVNVVLLSEWKRAEEKFKTNQARAEATNRKRATNAGRTPHEREAHALTGTGTLTGTSTETEKTFASTADAVPAASRVSPDRGALLDTLPLNDGTHYEVREDDLARDNPLYPGVDVPQAYRAMKAYLLANPRRTKTRGGIRRFMNNWLSRSQNAVRGVAVPARPDAAMGSVRACSARDEAAEAEEEAARREAALSYWREMKAMGRPIYAREAPRWVREALECVVSSQLPVLSCFQTDN